METAIAVRDAAFWWMGVWLIMNASTFAAYSVWKLLRRQRGRNFLREIQKLYVSIDHDKHDKKAEK